MKALFGSLLAALTGLVLTACESDVPPDPATRASGPIGQGALVQPDRSNDPIIRENTRVGY
jgi:hypothetical protein